MDVIKVNSHSGLPNIILLINVRAKLILIFKKEKIQDRGSTTSLVSGTHCLHFVPRPKITCRLTIF